MTLLRSVFFILLFTSVWHLSLPTASANRFDQCDQYDAEIESSVKRWWGSYQYPLAWKAQLYQESLCQRSAVSPVGARGLSQFMPGTWRDMERRYGIRASPHDTVAIDWGARYMALRTNGWKAQRPMHERWRLGLASYNAGFGNILNAQKLCGDARLWTDIKNCLSQVTGHNAQETKTYVERIERWWGEMAYYEPWEIVPELRRRKDKQILNEIAARFNVRRFFSGRAWCTYWQPWPEEHGRVWASADHCHVSMRGQTPLFIDSKMVRREAAVVDGVLYGVTKPTEAPREMVRGEEVYIVGFPGGSDEPTMRRGIVYLKRPGPSESDYIHSDTIVIIAAQKNLLYEAVYEPVVGGMSGGAVISKDFEPLAILVAQNAQTELTGDGILDSSADVVPLRSVWELENMEKFR